MATERQSPLVHVFQAAILCPFPTDLPATFPGTFPDRRRQLPLYEMSDPHGSSSSNAGGGEEASSQQQAGLRDRRVPSRGDAGEATEGPWPIPAGRRRSSRQPPSEASSVQNSLPPEVVKALETHLVPPPETTDVQGESESGTSSAGNVASSSNQPSGGASDAAHDALGSQVHSHQLQGGYMTRDLYKLKEKEDYLASSVPRAVSSTDLETSMERARRIAELKTPGGFRRHFVRAKAEEEGRELPNHITKSFIEFLLMYGNFGGDWYWEDEDGSEEQLGEAAEEGS